MTKVIEINGMRCGGCVRRVDNALNALGLDKVTVSLEDKKAIIECSADVSDSTLKDTVEKLGFTVVSIS